jgi:hypothetical protein
MPLSRCVRPGASCAVFISGDQSGGWHFSILAVNAWARAIIRHEYGCKNDKSHNR